MNTKFNMKSKNSSCNHLCTLGCIINKEVLMNEEVGLILLPVERVDKFSVYYIEHSEQDGQTFRNQ